MTEITGHRTHPVFNEIAEFDHDSVPKTFERTGAVQKISIGYSTKSYGKGTYYANNFRLVVTHDAISIFSFPGLPKDISYEKLSRVMRIINDCGWNATKEGIYEYFSLLIFTVGGNRIDKLSNYSIQFYNRLHGTPPISIYKGGKMETSINLPISFTIGKTYPYPIGFLYYHCQYCEIYDKVGGIEYDVKANIVTTKEITDNDRFHRFPLTIMRSLNVAGLFSSAYGRGMLITDFPTKALIFPAKSVIGDIVTIEFSGGISMVFRRQELFVDSYKRAGFPPLSDYALMLFDDNLFGKVVRYVNFSMIDRVTIQGIQECNEIIQICVNIFVTQNGMGALVLAN